MPAMHAKRIRISGAAFKRLGEALKEYKYEPKRREGFILDEVTNNRIAGRYFFSKVQKLKFTNPETLEEEEAEQPIMVSCRFAANLTNGVIFVRERRADLNVLEDVFNGVDGVHTAFEDFNTDPVEVYRSLADAQGRVDLRAIRIKDYLGREGLLTNANFKLMQPENEGSIFERYQDECQGVTLHVIVEGKRQNLKVTRKGSINHADELPLDIAEMALNFLPQFHEEDTALETVEV